ncbi:hypothetical protein QF117_10910 [Vibrio sp. YMD68]|uniref:hypothetical protein n=1 Tax=Vibrio sp. YMD68 TaxID=3042300 RepID=UPI00249B5600|nr:hypothetical protein [Vibrio sp. YMD68]WGW00140.1 hypothetical protein QF117_19995 [Vibrio sp. YMD68]WGW00164.1 hypothetical protein QF117_20145 [Vibrio sp. YMD68]WGW01298.1 hypothetical protein QF117_10910 [Vibrio sp. YMD68]
MSWYVTVGKAVAATASVAGVITAAPVFGAIGTISAAGFAVSTAIGTSAALIDKALEEDRPELPDCPTHDHPLITHERYNEE